MSEKILQNLGLKNLEQGDLESFSPIDGARIGAARSDNSEKISAIAGCAQEAFLAWRDVPPPVRGELVRLLGEELRAVKADLGRLVTIETGKILSEGLGEVQEMIDICDFAAGLSRQLYGLTIASERPGHHMREVWHPLGPVGIITAFNFPVAVWAWNAALALVCGNALVWKPSEKTPIAALACQSVFEKALRRFAQNGHAAPEHLSQLFMGGREAGEALAAHKAFPLISATGSAAMGRAVAQVTAARSGRSLLELGGNNAMIVAPSADQEMALRAIVFSAVGTCGQRCTSLRRVIIHETLYEPLKAALLKTYKKIRIGNPLEEGTLAGPLIDLQAFEAMDRTLSQAAKEGGRLLTGGGRIKVGVPENGVYVEPAIVEMVAQTPVVHHETFAPVLYLLKYKDLKEAIALNNAVPQGLSSCIFTAGMREAERFLSAVGSDCGIANVNIGTSGAEIGGAFGGEKETGGGRESGSDSWKAYMRRQTQTVNYSMDMPLAQGVQFTV